MTLWNKAEQGCGDWVRGDSIWLEQSLSETYISFTSITRANRWLFFHSSLLQRNIFLNLFRRTHID